MYHAPLHDFRIAEELCWVDLLIFNEDIAHNWEKLKREWHVYSNTGLSTASKKVKAYAFLNHAGSEALDKINTFEFKRDKDRKDLDVLIQKFDQLYLPVTELWTDMHLTQQLEITTRGAD